jgi:pimeloyl-ACP methyl ester carboxylesterase
MKWRCADVICLFDALEIERACLLGHDWGAAIGCARCMRAPARVERFVTLPVWHPASFAGAGLTQRVRSYYMLESLPRGVVEALLRAGDWFALRHCTRDEQHVAHWIDNFGVPARLSAALNDDRANVKVALRGDWPAAALSLMGCGATRMRS